MEMKFLPVSLNITDKKILIIGGGNVAAKKIKILEQFTNEITVVADDISKEIKTGKIICKEKRYHKTDLADYHIVYACTNNEKLNRRIKMDCEDMGKLINVVDNPVQSDFASPAIIKKGKMTVAVGSNAQNVIKSIELRNKIKDFLNNNGESSNN
jgi:siroheme synthase-like protein